MSEPETTPADPAPEPGPQAQFQHLDSPVFPDHIPGAREEELTKLALWVETELVPTWVYNPSARRPWCARWQEHPDAVSMLHALYRASQELMDTEQAGLAAPAGFILQQLLPGLAYLRSPDGPFERCIRGPRQIEHELPDPVATQE